MSRARFLSSLAVHVPWTAVQLLAESALMNTVARRPARSGERPWGHRHERISAEWLTGVLREQNALDSAQHVTGFTLQRFGEIGQMSAVYRLALDYSHAVDAPRTLVLKTTMPEMKNRLFNSCFGVFEREICTYRLPQPAHGLLRPKCWYAGQHPLTRAGFLIFDDLAGLRGVPAYSKLGMDDARRVAVALAEHHAQWWETPALLQSGFRTTLDTVQATMGPMCSMAWGKAQKVMVELVDADIVALLGRYVAHQQAVCRRIMAGPRTLVHGDLNTNNLFFDDAHDRVCAIDWQSTHIGSWAEDLAYVTLMCLATEDCTAHEQALIDLHRDTLATNGVNVDAAAHHRAYPLGVLQVGAMLIVAAMVIDQQKDPTLYEQYRSTISGWAEAARRHRLDTVLAELGA